MPKFSIITPTWLDKNAKENARQPRYEMFLRCANSVFTQTFTDFEWIIVDDMSEPPVEEILESLDSWWGPKGLDVKIIRLEGKAGRIKARNVGMEAATGDWITWLDSDDEYSSIYLEAMNDAIRVYPEYDIFNFNHLVFSYDYGTTVRKFMNMEIQDRPDPLDETQTLVKRPFGSGNIGAGSFVFKREIVDEIGPIPELGLWELSAHAMEEFPEIKPFFWNEANKGYNSLGNPWGEDYYYWYKMTRNHKAKYLNTALYYVHSRYNHKWADDPGREEESTAPEYNPKNI